MLFLLVASGCREKQAVGNATPQAVDSSLHREWHPENFEKIRHARQLLQTGDIALRTGADATSHALRGMNQKNATYSHCGIVSIEAGKPWIYHSLGGEDNPDATIRRETPEQFFAPLSNEGGGICRYPLTESQKEHIVQKAQAWYREARTFDMDFDLASDTQLYCAEFVYKSFLASGFPERRFTKSRAGGFEYIAIDDLYGDSSAKLIYAFLFK